MTIPSEIKDIYNAFHKAGKKLYIVGGAVRDMILGRSPKDFDLATDSLPDNTEKILKKNVLILFTDKVKCLKNGIIVMLVV